MGVAAPSWCDREPSPTSSSEILEESPRPLPPPAKVPELNSPVPTQPHRAKRSGQPSKQEASTSLSL